MTEPITRNEDADDLFQFRSLFRSELARQRAQQLDLFYRLQFPQDDTAPTPLPQPGNPMDRLATAAPEAVKRHALFRSLARRFEAYTQAARQALEQAAQGSLNPQRFLRLTAALQRLDRGLDHFHAAITASLTDVDELTGLLNRAAMERDLARELAHARRNQAPLCVAMVDADHFKQVNDTHGHDFGDVVLQALAERFENSLRPHDRVYRYGGEEFVMVLPETSLPDAVDVLNRLRLDVCATPIAQDAAEVVQFVSAGVAAATAQDDNEAVIKRADRALYDAKASGRNRVVAAD